MPAVVALPAEIDLVNRDTVCGRLDAAFASGAAVVIADFTATTFCDCGSLSSLLGIQQRAASRSGQLRLAIAPGNPVRRVADLIGLGSRLPVYASAGEAAAATSWFGSPWPRGMRTAERDDGQWPRSLN